MRRLLSARRAQASPARTATGYRRGNSRQLLALVPLLGLALFLLANKPADAAPTLAPGETRAFSTPDGGETGCRIGTLAVACGTPELRFNGTGFDLAAKEVRAVFDPVAGTVGEANHASAALFNDFTISASDPGPGGVIEAHVSAGFDYNAFLLGAAAYTVDAELNLVISDVTGGAPGVPVASTTLASRDRSGDQGLTDISAGGQYVVLMDEGGGLKALLQRGHTYRITVQATAYGAALVLGRPSSDVTVRLNSLHVTLDEDEVEQLAAHDAAVRAELAEHDALIQALIAQHDADIKARLDGIQDDLDEIKTLLITPQGLRPGFPYNNKSSGKNAPASSTDSTGSDQSSAGTRSRSSAWSRLFR